MLDKWLAQRLEDRKQKGLLRALPEQANLIDFTSNDYLGLSRNKELFSKIEELVSLEEKNGSTGSRLLSGNSPLAVRLEEKLAGIFRSESTLLFNSGYSANVAVLSAIPHKNDTIIYDELAHASIKDGARLSLARKFTFRHNDLEDLRRKLIRTTVGRTFVAVESVYSMDGDECPLPGLIALSEEYNFTIILDEAHSTGVRGPEGAGISVEKSLSDRVEIRIYTFGKGMGVCGACVAGSGNLIAYLVNFARPFIYTTAPAPHTVASIACAFDFLAANQHLQKSLQQKITRFLVEAEGLTNRTKSLSAIQTFILPGNERIRKAADALQKKGFDVRPILSPTVPAGAERLRICLHTYNSDAEIATLVEALHELKSGC